MGGPERNPYSLAERKPISPLQKHLSPAYRPTVLPSSVVIPCNPSSPARRFNRRRCLWESRQLIGRQAQIVKRDEVFEVAADSDQIKTRRASLTTGRLFIP